MRLWWLLTDEVKVSVRAHYMKPGYGYWDLSVEGEFISGYERVVACA